MVYYHRRTGSAYYANTANRCIFSGLPSVDGLEPSEAQSFSKGGGVGDESLSQGIRSVIK